MGENGIQGDVTTTSRLTPVDIVELTSDVRAIAGGGYHTCALTSAGGVKCWGYNHFGGLGDETIDRSTPVDVAGPGVGAHTVCCRQRSSPDPACGGLGRPVVLDLNSARCFTRIRYLKRGSLNHASEKKVSHTGDGHCLLSSLHRIDQSPNRYPRPDINDVCRR